MKCWICGSIEPTTREHRAKASDLRSVLGTPTQQTPFYLHTDSRRNRKVGSLKADALKFTHLICEACNSARTQPYDHAWAEFSLALRTLLPKLSPWQSLRFNRLFPYDTQRQMLNVHLYFVKNFGCQIIEGKMGIDTSSFSQALLNGTPHPNLYLSFGRKTHPVVVVAGSNVEAELRDGKIAVASWLYQIGELCVLVMYAVEGEHRSGLVNSWHPRMRAQRFTVSPL